MAAVTEPTSLVPLRETDGWKLVERKSELVLPKTIFEYMDGAGELYLAFQFRDLHVWQYARDGATTITVEAYRMGSPEEAFGVLSQDLDGEDAKIGRQSLYAAGLLRFWQGPWYFRILSEFETPQTRRVVLSLGQALAAQIPPEGDRPKLLARLPREGLLPQRVHYFHTQICLNALYFFAVENLLGLSEQTEAAMGDYRFDNQPASLLIIRYPDPTSATKACARFREVYLKGLSVSSAPLQLAQLENGEWVGLRLDREYLVLAFRSRSRDVSERLLKAVNLTNGGRGK